ncbi:MAG: PAS domain S-box protein [bacterium]|nr:PAS domain S-box protein [bacterium]
MPNLEVTKKNITEQSEGFYDLIENTPLCIKVFDVKGTLLFINKGGREEHFLKDTDDVGKFNWLGTVKKEYQPEMKRIFDSVLRGGYGEIDFEHTPESSKHAWCHGIISPLKDKDGNIKRILFYSNNITNRRAQEGAVRESEVRFRMLFESSRDALMTLEPPAWRFSSGNPATLKMFKAKDEKEFASAEPWRLSPEKQPDGRLSAEKAKEMIEVAMRDGSHFFEWVHRRMTGEDFPATVLLTRIDLQGKSFLQATVRDITEEKKNADQMRLQVRKMDDSQKALVNLLTDIKLEKEKSESLVIELNKFQLAVENAYEHIIIADPDGTVLYANKAAERITGYTRGEIIGSRPSLWGKQMPKEFYEQMWKTIKTDKRVFSGQIRNRRKNGEIYEADAQISPILDKDGNLKFFVGIERDITKEKEIDRQKSEFVTIASHQLRTPLTGIRWTIERLLKNKDVDAKTLESLTDITESASRLSDLVDALLNISRIESGTIGVTPVRLDIAVFLKNYFKETDPLCQKKNLTFNFKNQVGELEVVTDKNAFQNIIQSIVVNAIEYTPERGSVEVSLEKKENTFLVTVRDTGVGIPPEEYKKIFSKFFRASNAMVIKAGGTGVGLYIASEATKLLGGKIWFGAAL